MDHDSWARFIRLTVKPQRKSHGFPFCGIVSWGLTKPGVVEFVLFVLWFTPEFELYEIGKKHLVMGWFFMTSKDPRDWGYRWRKCQQLDLQILKFGLSWHDAQTIPWHPLPKEWMNLFGAIIYWLVVWPPFLDNFPRNIGFISSSRHWRFVPLFQDGVARQDPSICFPHGDHNYG